MFKIIKRKRAVSPVVATVLIIGLVLAAASIVFLVVVPMLTPDVSPVLILMSSENDHFMDYDNDGDCDFMQLQIMNQAGAADANITGITVLWIIGETAEDVSWQPFTESSALIAAGTTKTVRFIAEGDNNDEIPNGATVSLTILSNGVVTNTLLVSDPINVETGNPVRVEFVDGSDNPVVGGTVNFYRTTGEYAYTGQPTAVTGISTTYLFPGSYYTRASEGASIYYSDPFLHPGVGLIHLEIQGGVLTVMVKAGTSPIEGAVTYVYDTFGHYVGKNGLTGADGIVTFSLENGEYKIRADVAGITYYSNDVLFPNTSYVEIDTGGGDIFCRVIDGGNNPISNVRVYLFRASGSYFGKYATTNTSGLASFTAVPGGTLFKFRVDYLAYRLWSQDFGAAPGSVIDVNVGGGTIYVNVTDGSGFAIQNVRTYLFTQTGSYSGKYANSNSSGIATYTSIAGGWFKIRIDYLAKRFWSPVFNATNGHVVQASIGGGTLYGNITAGGNPLVNVRVYLFTDTNSYTGKYGNTDASGIVELQGVGESNYKMRVDYQAKRYWSPTFFFNETTVVPYDVGGGTVYANVTSGGTPISGVRVYAFTPTGSYTGTYANTNTSGIAEFNTLAGGDFKFRVDYLSRRFWSDVFAAAAGLIVDVDLGGGTVYAHLYTNDNYNISGVRIYLFTESGSYTGKYANTDANGIATFIGIGESIFKFRADYLGKRFWSNGFNATDGLTVEFNIGGGTIYVHLTDSENDDISGGQIHLFTSTGTYTGKVAYTNSTGWAVFPGIGDGDYRFRYRQDGTTYYEYFTAQDGLVVEFSLPVALPFPSFMVTAQVPLHKEVLLPS
ncbi:MAG: carboxypeptidase-like regulatory domain-containing protein [Candidatus Heimdallarchaeaceae archaeon]